MNSSSLPLFSVSGCDEARKPMDLCGTLPETAKARSGKLFIAALNLPCDGVQ